MYSKVAIHNSTVAYNTDMMKDSMKYYSEAESYYKSAQEELKAQGISLSEEAARTALDCAVFLRSWAVSL